MSCDLVETRMRIRPRESSLSHPFAAASFVPPSKGERTTPWLDRACDAVPTRLAATLHDERTGHRPEMRATSFLPTTLRRRAPTFSFGDPAVFALASNPPDAWRVFTTPHALRTEPVPAFRSGRSLPATSTDCASSDAPVTALRLSSSSLWALPEETPLPASGNEEVSASARPRSLSHVDP